VTAADVTRVANKYIDVSKLAIIAVGNEAEIKPPLSTLGKVTNLDITIPPPPRAKPLPLEAARVESNFHKISSISTKK